MTSINTKEYYSLSIQTMYWWHQTSKSDRTSKFYNFNMAKHYFYCEYEPNSYMCRLLSFGFKELRLQWALKWFTLSNCKVVGRLIAYTTNAYPKASTVCALKTIQQCAWLTSSNNLQNEHQITQSLLQAVSFLSDSTTIPWSKTAPKSKILTG